MKFLYPQFLWALAVLAVPLIIHLFNFRRYTTVYFSNTRFLQNVIRQSKAINRLKHLLIMLARMLALTMLVLAFAYPFIPAENTPQDRGNFASVYIDNSPSMTAGNTGNTLLASARTQAVEIIRNLPDNYKIQVLSNDFQGRQQRFYSKPDAIDLVDQVSSSFAFRTTDEIFDRVSQAFDEDTSVPLDVFVLSDFQQSVYEDAKKPSLNWRVNLLPFRENLTQTNVSIDSVWFEKPVLQPGFDQELLVKISQSGEAENRSVSVNLLIDNALQGAKPVELSGGSVTTSFTIRAGAAKDYSGEITVDAGAPFFDNTFYFTFSVARPFRILLTGSDERQSHFNRLLSDSIYQLQYTSLNSLDYTTLANFDLVIVDAPSALPSGFIQAMQTNLREGKNLVLIPFGENPQAVNEMLTNIGGPTLGQLQGKAKALDISYEDPHFAGVFTSRPDRADLPSVEKHFSLNGSAGFPLIILENGVPMASRLPIGEGTLIFLTSDLADGNLISHPVFVPLMLNAALYSRENAALYTISGSRTGPSFTIDETTEEPLAVSLTSGETLIPRQRTRSGRAELYDLPTDLKPGIYTVTKNNEQVGLLALNVTPEESQWQFLGEQEMATRFDINSSEILTADAGNLGFEIGNRYKGTLLWKWFLAAAILFLLIEILLIKIWK